MGMSVKAPLFWSTASSVGAQLVSFVAFAVLARTLGAETFGLVALAASVVDLLLILSSAGIADALVQRATLDEDEAATAFWANMALGLAFCVLVLALAEPIADFYHRPELAPVVRALALVFLLTPLGVMHNARLTRDMNFRALAFRNVAANVTGAVVGIVMALMHFGAWALVGQRLVMATVLAVLAWTATRWVPRLVFRAGAFMSFLRFGGYLSLSQLFIMLNGRIAELLSGVYFGPGVVAFIRAGGRVIDVLNQLTFAPFHQIAMPMQARVQHDPVQRNAVYVQLSRMSALFMFPCFMGVFALAPPIVEVVFGPGWGGASDAMRILALAVVPLQVNVLFIAALAAAGRSKLVLGWSIGQAALGIALVVAVAPWGWEAMLAVNVVRAYLLLPLAMILQRRVLGVGIMVVLRSVRPAAVSAVAMAAAVGLADTALTPALSALLRLVLLVPAGGAIFFAAYLLQDRSGIAMIRQFVQNRRLPIDPSPADAGSTEV
ncbi:MAG: lipopolysaccharide biosynthesis protein [Sphingomonas adhaesiva]|uniref:lipopolysaccharide biosynthesis protein n=1 Tax=Sphingomonas adhaesiva TaxID=28212 RepID=UPI002FF96D60